MFTCLLARSDLVIYGWSALWCQSVAQKRAQYFTATSTNLLELSDTSFYLSLLLRGNGCFGIFQSYRKNTLLTKLQQKELIFIIIRIRLPWKIEIYLVNRGLNCIQAKVWQTCLLAIARVWLFQIIASTELYKYTTYKYSSVIASNGNIRLIYRPYYNAYKTTRKSYHTQII